MFILSRDRIRTSINVLGDGYGAAIVYHMSKEELDKADAERKLDSAESGRLTKQEVILDENYFTTRQNPNTNLNTNPNNTSETEM